MRIVKIISTNTNGLLKDMLQSNSEIFSNSLNDACSCTGNECYIQ